MKSGSVIIDIAIDQGGNCEISEAGRTVNKHNVSISGIQNIPGTVARSSTWLFANNIYNFIKNLINESTGKFTMDDEIVMSCLVTYNGEVVHKGALEAMKITI